MLLYEKIQSTAFSPGEQAVVDFMLKNREKVEKMTVKEIAARCFCAPSTLIRIAHKLDFDGWNSLKDSFIEETNYMDKIHGSIDADFPFEKEDTDMAIARKLATLENESIQDTLELIDVRELYKAGKMLRQAKIIYVLTMQPNRVLTETFRANMMRIGKTVVISNEPVYSTWMMEKEDCAILISYSGETDISVQCAEVLNKRKLAYISMSNIGDTRISSGASASLKLCTREKLFNKIGPFSSSISMFYLLDVLYGLCYRENYEHYKKMKEEVGHHLCNDELYARIAAYHDSIGDLAHSNVSKK